jgi:RNA polymerase sigma-70 factor (ECF subfamily)
MDVADIFREYAELVYGSAYSITGRREDAEDVVQTVFMRLVRSGLPTEFQLNARGYLYRAGINEALNILRTRRRHPATDIALAEIPAGRRDESLRQSRRHDVGAALAQLHPKDAEVIILRYADDYTDAEIARLLGKSRVAIAVRLHRARARLKKLLSASLGEEP